MNANFKSSRIWSELTLMPVPLESAGNVVVPPMVGK